MEILKKWWFWVIVVIVIGGICWAVVVTTGKIEQTNEANTTSEESLPELDKKKFTGKEGLLIFHNLKEDGYKVVAFMREGEGGQEMTTEFNAADVDSCKTRLEWDKYFVSDITQDGDNVSITLQSKSKSSQICPAGTTDDR